jgi:hypothetical protein
MKVGVYSRERDFLYFLEHKEQITKRYPNQYVLLRGGQLVAACNSYNLAEEIANRMFPDGLYYIQHCGSR